MRDQPRYAITRSLVALIAGGAIALIGVVGPASAFELDPIITFNARPRDTVLVGEYPTGVANWGLNSWWVASTTGKLTTRSVSFNGHKSPSQTTGSVSIVGPHRLHKLDVYNGGTQPTDVKIECDSVEPQPSASASVAAKELISLATGWNRPCVNILIRSTNSWNTNFDNFEFETMIDVPFEPIITFNDRAGQNRPLTGEYPDGVINWGAGGWYHSAPIGAFTTKSISLQGPGSTIGNLAFVGGPRQLFMFQAHNTGTGVTTLTLECLGGAERVTAVSLAAGATRTIEIGWNGPCDGVRVSSTNGWDTNFDNWMVGLAP
jgi:hypothetical protein